MNIASRIHRALGARRVPGLVLAVGLCVASASAQDQAAPVQAEVSAPSPSAGHDVLDVGARKLALLTERERVSARRFAVIGPLLMTAAGVAAAAVGWGRLYTSGACIEGLEHCGWTPRRIGGVLLGTAGISLAVAGTAWLSVRVAQRVRRKRELERIDAEINLLNLRASISPWLELKRGTAFGLAGAIQF